MFLHFPANFECFTVHGAPRTQYEAQSIATTWDSFYKGIRADEDTSVCPTGEQIFGYIDTITRHIKPNIRGKPVASLSTIQGVWYKLIAMLTFRHADLRANYGPYHVKRIEVHLDQLVQRNLLTKGRWFEKVWLGVRVLQGW